MARVMFGRGSPSLKPGRGAAPLPSLWFAPAPGTPDWPGVVQRFDELAPLIDGIELYHTQFMASVDDAYPANGPNTLTRMVALGLLPLIERAGLTLSLDAPALKDWKDAEGFYVDDPAAYAGQNLEAIRGVERAGGTVHELSWDEPFAAGLLLRRDAPWRFARVEEHVREVQRQLLAQRPGLEFQHCEPYPALGLGAHVAVIERLRPRVYEVDVDYRAARQRGTIRQLQDALGVMQRRCGVLGVQFSVIVWGCDEKTDESFVRSARTLLAVVQDAVFAGRLRWPDRLVVQSWSDTSKEPRIVPATLPPERATSLWGLLRATQAAL